MLAGLLAVALSLGPAAAARPAPLKPLLAPPAALNIVHHRLKRRAVAGYQALEASIVAAYERAKMPLYWMTFQSTKDPRDVLYLNAFDTPEGLARASETYRSLAAAHPDLNRLSERLASLVESQSSLLTTRRDDLAGSRTDLDFSTMRALVLATVKVRPGHEGQFVDALRAAGTAGAPWMVYEANDESTFVLLSPLRSRAEAGRASPLPRALREARRAYRRADVQVYALSRSMSRVHIAPTKLKAH